MSEILEGQQLEVDNLLSFRGKILQSELNQILIEMKSYVEEQGAMCIGNPITATYEVLNFEEGILIDVELLLALDKIINGNEKFYFKHKLKIVNAVMVKHIGSPATLQQSCNDLNNYISDKKLIPITIGYNVTLQNLNSSQNNFEIHVYVGINPNVL